MNTKRIVVKVEIETLLDTQSKLDMHKLDRFAMTLANLNNSGKEILLVSSGAIALGMDKLDTSEIPEDFTHMQAIAAVGQAELIKCYQNVFDQYSEMAAQVLLTNDIMENDKWRLNTRNTFETLLQMGIIPIINENDVVSTTDIELGDNYPLALMVAQITNAGIILIKMSGDDDYTVQPRGGNALRVIGEGDLFDCLDTFCDSSTEPEGDSDMDGFPAGAAEIITERWWRK